LLFSYLRSFENSAEIRTILSDRGTEEGQESRDLDKSSGKRHLVPTSPKWFSEDHFFLKSQIDNSTLSEAFGLRSSESTPFCGRQAEGLNFNLRVKGLTTQGSMIIHIKNY
jgi:hypothetical protein